MSGDFSLGQGLCAGGAAPDVGRVRAGQRADRVELSLAYLSGAARQIHARKYPGIAASSPPPDVPALDETAVGTSRSLRQQMEQHRANSVCASCHSRMDVLGFGLENYNAVGQWRTQDGKFPVDPSGTFPDGKSFATPAELKTLLRANLRDFTRVPTEKMLTYALGRGAETYDRRTVRAIVRQTAQNGYRFQSLIGGMIHSVPFEQRRGVLKGPDKVTPKISKEIARKG